MYVSIIHYKFPLKMLHKYFKMISILLKAQISVMIFTTNVKTIDIGVRIL